MSVKINVGENYTVYKGNGSDQYTYFVSVIVEQRRKCLEKQQI